MFQITLKDARELSGYTKEEVAGHCGITEDLYRDLEDDFGKTPARIAFAICSLLKISLDCIYIRG
ncbi:MAG: helix-turn-helix transcriptional regulator [Desulfosporosinus sp.]|nr:helix-turn-helix transcriptional regulator [Desulfosporosinus sp.]